MTTNVTQSHEIISGLAWKVFSLKNKRPCCPRGISWQDPHGQKHKVQYQPTLEQLSELQGKGLQIGVPIPVGIVVLDLDSQNALKKLQKKTGISNLCSTTLSVKTGRGFHLYFLMPKSKLLPMTQLKNKINAFKDIDIKRHGGYMVCPPSTHTETSKYYKFIGNNVEPKRIPKRLKAYLKYCYKKIATTNFKRNILSDNSHVSGTKYISEAKLRASLAALSTDHFQSYEEYFQLLASVHHASGGCRKSMNVFLRWSRGDGHYDSSYQSEANRSMWLNCDHRKSVKVTYLTFIFLLRQHSELPDEFYKTILRKKVATKIIELTRTRSIDIFKKALNDYI